LLHLRATLQLWQQETHSMNQQQNCNEQLMISPRGHLNCASNPMKLNLHISVSPTKRLSSDQLFLMANTAKYLGITLDAKLRLKAHIKRKQGELQIKFRKMYWLLGRRSELSMYNTPLI
jgi:hypothetical protein